MAGRKRKNYFTLFFKLLKSLIEFFIVVSWAATKISTRVDQKRKFFRTWNPTDFLWCIKWKKKKKTEPTFAWVSKSEKNCIKFHRICLFSSCQLNLCARKLENLSKKSRLLSFRDTQKQTPIMMAIKNWNVMRLNADKWEKKTILNCCSNKSYISNWAFIPDGYVWVFPSEHTGFVFVRGFVGVNGNYTRTHGEWNEATGIEIETNKIYSFSSMDSNDIVVVVQSKSKRLNDIKCGKMCVTKFN